jgi:hypothetical protein
MSHGAGTIGLGGASARIDTLAKSFIECLMEMAPHMPVTDNFDYPAYKIARFYVRTPQEVRGLSLSADQLEDPQYASTQAFNLANEIMRESDRIIRAQQNPRHTFTLAPQAQNP